MSGIDLIPADYARAQTVRRRLRRLMVACVAVAALTVFAKATLAVLLSAEKDELARLQATKRLWQEAKTRTDQHAGEASATEKQLAALAELRGRDHVRLLLEAVDRAYVEKVWFDEIRYFRRELAGEAGNGPGSPRTAGAARAAGGASGAQHVEQRVSMVGHAMNHVTLAEFMKRLELQPAVAELNLVDTSPRSYPHAMIIDFKLSLAVDPNRKARP